jgi:hypothetical protein
MARQTEPLADYLAVAFEDLRFAEAAARDGTLTTEQMVECAKTFTNAATKLRREAEKNTT